MDENVPEPLGGAHTDQKATADILKFILIKNLEELLALPAPDRLKKRYEKFRAFGNFLEKAPTPAEKAAGTKKSPKKTKQLEVPMAPAA